MVKYSFSINIVLLALTIDIQSIDI